MNKCRQLSDLSDIKIVDTYFIHTIIHYIFKCIDIYFKYLSVQRILRLTFLNAVRPLPVLTGFHFNLG